MDDKFKRIEDKIDRIETSINQIDKTLARNTDSLEFHIKRTNLLEKKVEHVDHHVTMVNGVLKFILGLSALAGLIKLFM